MELVGTRLGPATATDAEWLGEPERSALQVVRAAWIENEDHQTVLGADTVTRFLY